MSTRTFLLHPLLTALLLCACRTLNPPPRPLANLYPSLEPVAILETLQPHPLNAAWLRQQLSAIALDRLLQQTGFLEHDWDILARGLSHRGYAEIDARKTTASLRWVIFRNLDAQRLVVTAAFAHLPPVACRGGLQPEQTPPTRTTSTGDGQTSEWHTRIADGTLLILRALAPVGPAGPLRWQIALLITHANEETK